MKTITIQDIRDLDPCYDPTEHLPEGWTGTLLDILKVEKCPPADRLWVVTGFVDDKINRLFAVYCAKQAISLIDNPDPRSLKAIEVAEKYANNKATENELSEAREAASAAKSAAGAARNDAYSAACAAEDATHIAARRAARNATYDAAYAAYNAGRVVAMRAAWSDQVEYMKTLLEKGNIIVPSM